MNSRHLNPPLWDHAYLTLRELSASLSDIIAKNLSPNVTYRILDLGCGNKPYYQLFQDFATDYIGIDVARGEHVDIIGIGKSIPFIKDSFDIVFCTQVLEHVENPNQVVKEIHRVLSPKGMVILSTHGVWVKHGDIDNWRWTDTGLVTLFQPFFDVRVSPNGGAILCLAQLINLYTIHLPIGKKLFHSIFNVCGLLFDKLIMLNGLSVNYTLVGMKR